MYGSTINFSASAEAHFPWGQAKLLLQITKGKITKAQLYTDAMDATLPDVVCPILADCRLDADEIKQKLNANLPKELADDFVELFKQII